MKKRLFIFLFILVLAVSVIAVACNRPVEHTHSYGEWEVVTPATCTTAGSRVRTCSCGEKETQSIPATGHKFGEWTTVKEATETEEGLQERTCSVCGAKETRKIDKLPAPTEPVAKTDGITKVSLQSSNKTSTLAQYSKKVEISGVIPGAVNDDSANNLALTFTYINATKNKMFKDAQDVAAVLYANVGDYNIANGTNITSDAFSALSDEQKTKTPAHVEGAYMKLSGVKYWLVENDGAATTPSLTNKASGEQIIEVSQNETRTERQAIIQSAAFNHTLNNLRGKSTSQEITISWTGIAKDEVKYTIDWSKATLEGSDMITKVSVAGDPVDLGNKIGTASRFSSVTKLVEDVDDTTKTNNSSAKISIKTIVNNKVTLTANGSALLERTNETIYDASKAKKSGSEEDGHWGKNSTFATKKLDAGYIIPIIFKPYNENDARIIKAPSVSVSDTANAYYLYDAETKVVTVLWRIDENNTKELQVTIRWTESDPEKTYTITTDSLAYAGYPDGVTTINVEGVTNTFESGNTAARLDRSGGEAAMTATQAGNAIILTGDISYFSADKSAKRYTTAGYYASVEYKHDISIKAGSKVFVYDVLKDQYKTITIDSGADTEAKLLAEFKNADPAKNYKLAFKVDGKNTYLDKELVAHGATLLGTCSNDGEAHTGLHAEVSEHETESENCVNWETQQLKVTLVDGSNQAKGIKVELSYTARYNLSENATPSTSFVWENGAKTSTYNVSVKAKSQYKEYVTTSGKVGLSLQYVTGVSTDGARTYEAIDPTEKVFGNERTYAVTNGFDYDEKSIVLASKAHDGGTGEAAYNHEANKYYYEPSSKIHTNDKVIRGEGNYVYLLVSVADNYYTDGEKITYSVNGVEKDATIIDKGASGQFIVELKLTTDKEEVNFAFAATGLERQEYKLVFTKLAAKVTTGDPVYYTNGEHLGS